MKTPKKAVRAVRPKRRPAVLVRFYASDLAALNKRCADDCTPRENFIRRLVLAELGKGK